MIELGICVEDYHRLTPLETFWLIDFWKSRLNRERVFAGATVAAINNTKRTKRSDKVFEPKDIFPAIKTYAELAREAAEMAEAAKPENRRERALALRETLKAAFGSKQPT